MDRETMQNGLKMAQQGDSDALEKMLNKANISEPQKRLFRDIGSLLFDLKIDIKNKIKQYIAEATDDSRGDFMKAIDRIMTYSYLMTRMSSFKESIYGIRREYYKGRR